MDKEDEIERAITHRNSLLSGNSWSYHSSSQMFFVYGHGSWGAIEIGGDSNQRYSVNVDRNNEYSIASLAKKIRNSKGYSECKFGVHLFVCYAAKDCGGGLILAQELANELELIRSRNPRGVVAIEGLYGFDGVLSVMPDELLFVPLGEGIERSFYSK